MASADYRYLPICAGYSKASSTTATPKIFMSLLEAYSNLYVSKIAFAFLLVTGEYPVRIGV